MKRLIAVISGLLVLPAFAEVAPSYYYEDVVEYVDAEPDDVVVDDAATDTVTSGAVNVKVSPRAAAGTTRSVSRAIPSGTQNVATRGTAVRPTTTRATVTNESVSATRARTATASNAGAGRGTVTRAATSRAAQSTSGTAVSPRATASSKPATTARASILQSDTVRTPLYTGRVSTRTSSVSARVPTISVTSGTASTATSDVTVASTTSMDELAQITDFCKAQYTQCMDNFCNVLDDNQGRCSCSANLKNYEKTEAALKQATEDLQEVAQKIQYIGLSADEITTLFAQTEAELALQQSTDNTQLKNDLDKIKKLIVDVKSGSATSNDTGISMDLSGLLDFSIGSTGFDLANLFGNVSSNTSSISNQRGETLYKTATARCKASVLNSCVAQGVDASVVTNAYDLEIDKQCIAYERGLTDSNDQMASTVRNAKSVLQRARLMVAQQKNSYDLRGCISALDVCMQDDFVCGSDYKYCLDPTGKYIVNGDVVAGSQPGVSGDVKTSGGLYSVWNYTDGSDGAAATNAWLDGGSLGDFIDKSMIKSYNEMSDPRNTNIAKYLQSKIGYIDKDGKAQGLCVSVLNKCQDYTYSGTGNKTYQTDNVVVRGLLERVLMQIKSGQDEVLADYAEGCTANVYSCLNQNKYYYGNNNSYSNDKSYSLVAIKACNAQIVSCMSATGADTGMSTTSEIETWLKDALAADLAAGSGMTEARCLSVYNDFEAEWKSDMCVISLTDKEIKKHTFVYRDALKAFNEVDGSKNESSCTGMQAIYKNKLTIIWVPESGCLVKALN